MARTINGGTIVAPDHHHETVKKLFAQLTSRRQKAHSRGGRPDHALGSGDLLDSRLYRDGGALQDEADEE